MELASVDRDDPLKEPLAHLYRIHGYWSRAMFAEGGRQPLSHQTSPRSARPKHLERNANGCQLITQTRPSSARPPSGYVSLRACRLDVSDLLLGWQHVQERECCCSAAEEVGHEVDPDVGPLEKPGNRGAHCDGGVEGAAGDAADRQRAGYHREADGEAVERVALGAAGCGDVQDDPGQGERIDELDDQHLAVAGDDGVRLAAAHVAHQQPRDHRGDELGCDIGAILAGGHPPAQEYRGAHRRVEVAAGHVASGEHHHHQHRPDRNRRQRAGAGLVGGHADREHENEHAEELDRQLALKFEAHAFPFRSAISSYTTTLHSSRAGASNLLGPRALVDSTILGAWLKASPPDSPLFDPSRGRSRGGLTLPAPFWIRGARRYA